MQNPPPITVASWLRMNLRALPYMLIFPALLLAGEVYMVLDGKAAGEIFNKQSILGYIELVWIPLFAVNMIYFAGKAGKKHGLSLWKYIVLKLVVAVVAVLIATAVMDWVYEQYGIEDDDYIVLGDYQMSAKATNLVTNAVIALAIGAPLFVSQERKSRLQLDVREKALELQKLQRLQTQSRLEALQAKLNPHFLYNSLNTIASLVYDQPAKAEQMILGLSTLFRYSLQKDDKQLVTLAEEVEIAKTYLAIELVRFQGMLEYSVDVQERLLNHKVPKFLLQPLVENAVKHGTSKIAQGKIQIRIYNNELEQMVISVEDNGPPFSEQMEMGFGLQSTMEKLKLLLPQQHEFSITNAPVKAVTIVLKAEPHEPV